MFEAGIIDEATYNAGVQSIMLDDLANADKYVGYYRNAPLSSTEADADANTSGNNFWTDLRNLGGNIIGGLGTMASNAGTSSSNSSIIPGGLSVFRGYEPTGNRRQ